MSRQTERCAALKLRKANKRAARVLAAAEALAAMRKTRAPWSLPDQGPAGKTIVSTRDRNPLPKGAPYRRLVADGSGRAIHATKGRSHDAAVLAYRTNWLLARAAR